MVFGALFGLIGDLFHFFWHVLTVIFHFFIDVVVAIVTISWTFFVTLIEALTHIFTLG